MEIKSHTAFITADSESLEDNTVLDQSRYSARVKNARRNPSQMSSLRTRKCTLLKDLRKTDRDEEGTSISCEEEPEKFSVVKAERASMLGGWKGTFSQVL